MPQSLHPDHLKSEKPFELSRRADLINHMQEYIKAEPKTSVKLVAPSMACGLILAQQ